MKIFVLRFMPGFFFLFFPDLLSTKAVTLGEGHGNVRSRYVDRVAAKA